MHLSPIQHVHSVLDSVHKQYFVPFEMVFSNCCEKLKPDAATTIAVLNGQSCTDAM